MIAWEQYRQHGMESVAGKSDDSVQALQGNEISQLALVAVGILPPELARKTWPDAIVSQPIRQVQRIGVITNGHGQEVVEAGRGTKC